MFEELAKHLEKKKNRTLQYMLNAMIAFIGVLVVATLVFVMSFTFVRVCGISMMPTLEHHSYGLAVSARRVNVDDIVIVRMPAQVVAGEVVHTHNIKRVVALGGDTVVFQRGLRDESNYVFLYVVNEDGIPTRESGNERFDPIIAQFNNRVGDYFRIGERRVVPEGEVMVLGDNRNNSIDSRDHDFVAMERLRGRFIHGFYPQSFSERFMVFLFRMQPCTAVRCRR
ncbi:MAG: signal peptidase I [Firmicutes bacterium]|nr:signal peptidase I [Bacillota bacterium]